MIKIIKKINTLLFCILGLSSFLDAASITNEVSQSLYSPLYSMFMERYYSPFPLVGAREGQKLFLGFDPFWDKYPLEVIVHERGYEDYIRRGYERMLGLYGSVWCSPNSSQWIRTAFSIDWHGLRTFCKHDIRQRADLLVAIGNIAALSENIQAQFYILGGAPLEKETSFMHTGCFINLLQPRSPAFGVGGDMYIGNKFFWETLQAGLIASARFLNFTTSNKNAVDLLVGLTGVWGPTSFEVGYNPTFMFNGISSHDKIKHTAYAFGYYTFYFIGLPLSIGIGVAWTPGDYATTMRIVL